MASREGNITVKVTCLPLKRADIVTTLLDGCVDAGAHVVALGSLELVKQMKKDTMALGSVAEQVSKPCLALPCLALPCLALPCLA